jgi:hypothetical protein
MKRQRGSLDNDDYFNEEDIWLTIVLVVILTVVAALSMWLLANWYPIEESHSITHMSSSTSGSRDASRK